MKRRKKPKGINGPQSASFFDRYIPKRPAPVIDEAQRQRDIERLAEIRWLRHKKRRRP